MPRTIHLVYAGDPGPNHLHSPYNITHHLYHHFKDRGYTVHYYDWCHTGDLNPVAPNDLILGHPNYPANTPIQRLFTETSTPHKYLIFPIHHAIPEINQPFTTLVHAAKKVFGIMGPYWYDTLEQSALASWKPKITRLDMAIDTKTHPWVRHGFNPKGQRTFAYIGCDRPEKGTHNLYEIFRKVPYTLHVYGNFSDCPLLTLPNVKYHGFIETSPAFAHGLCRLTDVFLNTSISDANPTTLLEAAAWGLVVACSKQSGYWPGAPFWGLNLDDTPGIINLLQYVQTCDEQVLLDQAHHQRICIEDRYTWERFLNTITNNID